MIEDRKFKTSSEALTNFNRYAYSFGLGKKLGVDIPTEQGGNIPVAATYNKIFGPRWVSCNIISNAIGQGEVETTLLQLSNAMATIANKGWYCTPHLVDSIENATTDDQHMLDSFKVKHRTLDIPDKVFEIVHDGMQEVMEFGTGAAAQVPGIVVCGKTGTVENAYHGVKQQDHAFFGAFAPRDNPRIAIAVMCENAGKGAQSAAPIASLMIEQYLKDSIPEPDRKALVEEMAAKNLIPRRMIDAMNSLDSARRVHADSLQRIKEQRTKDSIVNKYTRQYQKDRTNNSQASNTGKQPAKKDQAARSSSDIVLIPGEKKGKPNKNTRA